ncbi:MAG TPA: transposase family protein [bacterium]|nr:transposase family protein [bacterium]
MSGASGGLAGYDRNPRRWRHLDTCQLQTWIEAEIPRVQCPQHGVKQIAIPWDEPGSQFTLIFERLAVDFLRECSVTGAAALLRIRWDKTWGIKARAVRRGLARRTAEPIPQLGVDEKAITKGHRYLTVVADLQRQRVLFLNDDRTAESPDAFWPTCTPHAARQHRGRGHGHVGAAYPVGSHTPAARGCEDRL